MDTEKMALWLGDVVKGLVTVPEDVSVTVNTPDEMGVLFVLKLNDKDAARIIGKSGKNAVIVRSLLRLAGSFNNVRASLKIDVPPVRSHNDFGK